MQVPRDESAWRAFFEQAWPYVLATAYRELRGHMEAAQDAAQEVFVRLARYRPFAVVREQAAFQQYLAGMARNAARTVARRMGRVVLAIDSNDQATLVRPDPREPSPEAVAARDDLLDRILRQLRPDECRLLRLLIDGCGPSDVSRVFGISYSNAGVRIHRLRGKLGKLLPQKDIEPSPDGV